MLRIITAQSLLLFLVTFWLLWSITLTTWKVGTHIETSHGMLTQWWRASEGILADSAPPNRLWNRAEIICGYHKALQIYTMRCKGTNLHRPKAPTDLPSTSRKDGPMKTCTPLCIVYLKVSQRGRQPGWQNIRYSKYTQECLRESRGMLMLSQIANLAMNMTMWRQVVVYCTAAERWWWSWW